MLYRRECLAFKNQHENKISVANIKMLRWMYGETRRDKIRYKYLRAGIVLVVEKMVKNRLKWFRHVERGPADSVVRRIDQMKKSQTTRDKAKPRKIIRETIKKEINELDKNMVCDRTL